MKNKTATGIFTIKGYDPVTKRMRVIVEKPTQDFLDAIKAQPHNLKAKFSVEYQDPNAHEEEKDEIVTTSQLSGGFTAGKKKK